MTHVRYQVANNKYQITNLIRNQRIAVFVPQNGNFLFSSANKTGKTAKRAGKNKLRRDSQFWAELQCRKKCRRKLDGKL